MNLTTTISKLSRAGEWAISNQGFISYLTREIPEESMSENANADRLRERFSLFFNQRQSMQTVDNYAIIHVYGPLLNDASPFDLAFGASSYDEIIADIEEAIDNPKVTAIIMRLDSPGGMVSGCLEACNAITRARETKPVFGYVEGYATSACYKLASCCQHIGASASATIGNIGTILSWYDLSKYFEAIGVTQHTITNEGADLKSTFKESPTTGAQLAFLQARTDEMGAAFWDKVISNRPQIDEECKRAGWYQPERAGELGLIDSISTQEEFKEIVTEMIDIESP